MEPNTIVEDIKRATGHTLFDVEFSLLPIHVSSATIREMLRTVHPDRARAKRAKKDHNESRDPDVLPETVQRVSALLATNPDHMEAILMKIKSFNTMMKSTDVRLVAALASMYCTIVEPFLEQDPVANQRRVLENLARAIGLMRTRISALALTMDKSITTGRSDETEEMVNDLRGSIQGMIRISSKITAVVNEWNAASLSASQGDAQKRYDIQIARGVPPRVVPTNYAPVTNAFFLRMIDSKNKCGLCQYVVQPGTHMVKFCCKSSDDSVYHFDCVTKMWSKHDGIYNQLGTGKSGLKMFGSFCPVHIKPETSAIGVTLDKNCTEYDSEDGKHHQCDAEFGCKCRQTGCGLYFV